MCGSINACAAAKARRLNHEKLAVAKKEFATMEELRIIRRSCLPWASPLHIVKKKDDRLRPCNNFRRLNTVTTPDKYPIPFLQDCMHFLAGSKFFSKVDLVRGYHHIPVAPKDVKKTPSPQLLGPSSSSPFGLKNAAQVFQRLMDQVTGDLKLFHLPR